MHYYGTDIELLIGMHRDINFRFTQQRRFVSARQSARYPVKNLNDGHKYYINLKNDLLFCALEIHLDLKKIEPSFNRDV